MACSTRERRDNSARCRVSCSGYLFLYILFTLSNGARGFRTLDYPTYSAVVGKKVALPCNVTPPSIDDGISLVLWYRGDNGTPIYNLDARYNSPEQAKHLSHKVLGSRAYFNLSSRPAALHITHLMEDDAAEYRCRVDFRRARTKNKIMKLVIITPPKEIAIKIPSNRTAAGLIGPYDEGTSLNLICEARGGKPPPAVTWWRESTLLDETYEVSPQLVVFNELLIGKLQRTDLLSKLTCQAANTNLTLPLSSTVTIDMNLKPQDIRIITPFQGLSAGGKMEISCQSTGSRPPAKITWWKDKEEISQSRESVSSDGSITISFLYFVPSSGDNARKLSCRAQNIKMENSTLEDAWKLNIFYRPQLTLALGASIQHSVISEGSEVYFECNIQSNPAVAQVNWLLERRELQTDRNNGIIINNNSLIIRDVRREHRGNYQCSASNTEGEGKSEQVLLSVRFAPVCKRGQRVQYGVAKHETATINCDVEADPPNVTFQWNFNNSYEVLDVVHHSTSGTSSSAQFTPRSKSDYGYLYCWAKNSIGMQQDPCIFAIVPAGPPEGVEACSVLNQTATTLYMECEKGDDGGLPQEFHLEVYSAGGDDLQANLTARDEPLFFAEGLAPGSTFLLVVYASNPKGRGPSVSLTATTLFSAKRRIGETPAILVSPVLAVLLGIVGLLVLLAIIIILIMKKIAQKESDDSSDLASSEKLQSPLTVNKDMRMDGGDDRCPDIIPPNNYITAVADGRIYENLRSEKEPTYENIIKRVHFKTKESDGELTYAELILPPSCDLRMIRRDDPPTEYADINFQRRGSHRSPGNSLEDIADPSLICNKCHQPPPTPPLPLMEGCLDSELSTRSPSM